jgi:lipopolysaccharide transport system ATP-binding protein
MNEVATSGRTVLFVSHNMAAVESLCSRAILLEAGELTHSGPTLDVLHRYQRSAEVGAEASRDLSTHSVRPSDAAPLMKRVTLRDEHGRPSSSFPMGEPLVVEVEFASPRPFDPVLGLVVKTDLGSAVCGLDNRIVEGYRFDEVTRGTIACRIPSLPLTPGGYILDLYLGDRQRSLDRIRDAIGFCVVAKDVFGTGKLPPAHCGPIWLKAAWELSPPGGAGSPCGQAPRPSEVPKPSRAPEEPKPTHRNEPPGPAEPPHPKKPPAPPEPPNPTDPPLPNPHAALAAATSVDSWRATNEGGGAS